MQLQAPRNVPPALGGCRSDKVRGWHFPEAATAERVDRKKLSASSADRRLSLARAKRGFWIVNIGPSSSTPEMTLPERFDAITRRRARPQRPVTRNRELDGYRVHETRLVGLG